MPISENRRRMIEFGWDHEAEGSSFSCGLVYNEAGSFGPTLTIHLADGSGLEIPAVFIEEVYDFMGREGLIKCVDKTPVSVSKPTTGLSLPKISRANKDHLVKTSAETRAVQKMQEIEPVQSFTGTETVARRPSVVLEEDDSIISTERELNIVEMTDGAGVDDMSEEDRKTAEILRTRAKIKAATSDGKRKIARKDE